MDRNNPKSREEAVLINIQDQIEVISIAIKSGNKKTFDIYLTNIELCIKYYRSEKAEKAYDNAQKQYEESRLKLIELGLIKQ